MSETNDTVTDSVELENVETPNTALAIVGGALLGVAAVTAFGYVAKKFRARKEPVHIVTDLEDENPTS